MKHIQPYKLFESLRDKMKPKTEEEVAKVYSNLIKDLGNLITDFPENIDMEFKKIAELFNVEQKDLYLISEDEGNYDMVNEYFGTLVEGEEMIPIRMEETDDINSGDWLCYPSRRLARWSSDGMGEMSAWIFNKDYFLNGKVDESLRDKMTSKSDEEILNSLKSLDPDRMLVQAAKNKSIEGVKKALKLGADIHYFNNLALQVAIDDENLDIIKYLIDKDADIHMSDDYPLRHSVEVGNTELVKYLLDNGAEPDTMDNYELVIAEENNYTEIIKLLKKKMGIK